MSGGLLAPLRHMALGLLLACAGALAGAGEIIAFEPGKPLPNVVLGKLPMRGVIAEFLDPEETGLGKELSYILWREVLAAISDQAGAGVILARAPGDQRITSMLGSDYHRAALKIAESQGARMAVWGFLDEQEQRISVEVFLSLIDDTPGSELALRLRVNGAETGLGARIGRTKFNFAPVLLDRKTLFQRLVVSRPNAPVRAKGSNAVLATLPAGVALRAVGLRGRMFEVVLADGRRGEIDIGAIELPPRTVALPASVPLKAEPREQSATRATSAGAATAEVANMSVTANGTWYRVAVPGGEGWVPQWRVRPQYSMPAVLFIAGIYRYQLGKWDEAARAFEQFTQSPGVEGDNLSLSTAYQLLGASRLMAASRASNLPGAKGWEQDYANALRQTPLDADVYTLRGVAQLAVKQDLDAATNDLARALKLDPAHTGARQSLRALDAHARGGPPAPGIGNLRLPSATAVQRGNIDTLVREYKLRVDS
ncbi:MAG: hypothetical protein K8R60_18095 [Burkholderiales bacterium]|nr:hypothetical protein [Burkholderiales bacterium]